MLGSPRDRSVNPGSLFSPFVSLFNFSDYKYSYLYNKGTATTLQDCEN